MGCSDPPPPPANGGLHLELRGAPSTPAGLACPTSGSTHDFGLANSDGSIASPSASTPGTPLIDGEENARIRCTVKGGGPFQFDGEINGLALRRTTAMREPIRLTVFGGSVASGMPGTAQASIYTQDSLGGDLSTDAPGEPCTFTPLQVEAGRLWSQFSCRVADTPHFCQASGVVLFENCLTE
jgi:hypothetical protein